MRSDRPAPILVEQAPRELPEDAWALRLDGAPSSSCEGALFVDELFRDRRISSVEWQVLRTAIWPIHPLTGEALFQLKEQPTPLSARQGG